MGLIAVNIIGLIMFILAIVMFVLADSMVGIAIGVAISVVWLTFTITANVHILKGRRSTEKLKDSARGHLFDAQIERLNRQYESIMSREEYFQENVEEGSGIRNLYEDIKKRTNGEIYLGVVGPVRTGKSTFVKRFMDLCVIPEIADANEKQRTIDELPQSSAGSTIMTTEPKFIPGESAAICMADDIKIKVRAIDCVGFMVDGAMGAEENGKERMVNTPLSKEPVPFSMAAQIGTEKVIEEHSTIGIVITTDGSFTGIERDNYVNAEQMAIDKLKKISKPFVVILNCVKPYAKESVQLAEAMKEKYGVNVYALNCDQLRKEDVDRVISGVLKEFPVSQLDFYAPAWVEVLESSHWLKMHIVDAALSILDNINVMKDAYLELNNTCEYIEKIDVKNVDMSTGRVEIEFKLSKDLYYKILSELTGTQINNEHELIDMIKSLSDKKNELGSFGDAISEVNLNGFGVVTPSKENIQLDEPVVIKNGNKYGVKIKAKVPSINLLKTEIMVEIAPIVGNRNQAEDLIEYIKGNMKDNPDGIWDTNIFGKTIEQIVSDGIYEKTHNMTTESMGKIGDTIEKVMNENSGLVCLIV